MTHDFSAKFIAAFLPVDKNRGVNTFEMFIHSRVKQANSAFNVKFFTLHAHFLKIMLLKGTYNDLRSRGQVLTLVATGGKLSAVLTSE